MWEVNPDVKPDTQAPQEPHPAWRRVLLARHPKRPHSSDYIERLFPGFSEVHGDRSFGDDPAIIAGFAELKDARWL